MKFNRQYTFITLVFFGAVIISCSKMDEIKPKNTDNISGTYAGFDSSYSFSQVYDPTNNTVTQKESIKVALDTEQVVFKIDSNRLLYFGSRKVNLDEDNSWGYWFGSNGGGEGESIEFRNDSVIYLKRRHASINSIWFYYTFIGKKIK